MPGDVIDFLLQSKLLCLKVSRDVSDISAKLQTKQEIKKLIIEKLDVQKVN